MSNSEFSADAVRKHQETVVSALKVNFSVLIIEQGYFRTERDLREQ